jgi:ParB family transcriptional regulator, chromosome partitioning protein
MPDIPTNKPTTKARLGRGLGSLLGGDLQLDETSHRPANDSSHQANTSPASSTAKSTQAASPAPRSNIDEQSQIWKIAVDRLHANPNQPRQNFEPEALKELSASIKEKGILQPIVARRIDERNFEIIAGERRWRAAQLAGLHEVPVILKKVESQAAFELAIIENIQRQDLDPIEEAEAYDRLMHEFHLTQQQVAEKVGKERATIANVHRLLALPAELKTMMRKRELSSGHAKVLLSVEDSAEQVRLAKRIVEQKLSVRAAEQLIVNAKRAKANFGKPAASPSPLNLDVSKRLVAGLASELQKLIGTKVTIDYSEGKGKLAIQFYSDEELSSITDKIRNAWQK